MKIVLLGHMGRDEAAAERLSGHELHVIGQWLNPGLVEKSRGSGGQFYTIDSITDARNIADLVQHIKPDMFVTNFDDALAAGVVDTVRERMPNILFPCPDRAAARVEWDKFYLREIIEEIDPSYNPVNFMAQTVKAVKDAVAHFESSNIQIAVKPRNLTGGKGVKVQGKHFATHAEGRDYAVQVLAAGNQQGVEIQEKLVGHEFTLQIFTDGTTLIEPPLSYDYPYREDGDDGPGTGGMGAFTMQDGLMPFVTSSDYKKVMALMRQMLAVLRKRGLSYKGVLYPTFFKTPSGLKIVEVNARGGDPELINILDLLEDNTDFGEVLKLIALGKLQQNSVRYKKLASAMVYLVSPDYGYRKGPSYEFKMDKEAIVRSGCKVRFAAAEYVGTNRYCTVGSSRVVGISALGRTPWEARRKIHEALAVGLKHPLALHYRQQIAEEAYIKDLTNN